MTLERSISDTAFLVNESRRRKESISEDIYAKHWVPHESLDRIVNLWDRFAEEVYPFDDLELSIRNKYFLSQIRSFNEEEPNAILINLGAGFTSYPFLLEHPMTSIEVDLPAIISYKKEKCRLLSEEDILPRRDLKMIAADLSNEEDLNKLESVLRPKMNVVRSFCLIEGVTYYLSRKAFVELLQCLQNLQLPGSLLAFDYWNSEIKTHPVFLRLNEFFKDEFQVKDYNLLAVDDIKSISGYQVKELTNVAEQEFELLYTNHLAEHDKILPENYAVLKRI